MPKYFVKFDNGTACKNKAQEAVYAYVRELDGVLLSDQTAKNDFHKKIKEQIERINRAHLRCGNINISSWQAEGENISFGGGICFLRIYIVKKYL